MEPIKLTLEILKKLKPTDIIYAEFAQGGAMGDPGTARIFTVKQGKLIFYHVNAFDGENEEVTWAATSDHLHKLAKQGDLEEQYAGFGNHAWKKSDAEFSRNDDDHNFIYEKNGKTYQIPASCPGVYDHVVAKFAKREISLEAQQEYFKSAATSPNLTDEEYAFCQQYFDYCQRVDHGEGWFDFTIEDYMGAIAYIHHLDGTEPILNPEDRANCNSALQKYRLRYVAEITGWNELNKFFTNFVLGERTDLFKALSQLIETPLAEVFTKVKIIKSNCTELEATQDNNIESLFIYQPVLVNFPEEVHIKIITGIQKMSPTALRASAKSIAFYFANYILNEDKLPLIHVLPAAAYVIENLPLDDFNHTHADQLLWVAGEIINDAWKCLDEDEEKQAKYRKLVYELYWPRIGSLWPIIHYDEFKFNNQVTDKMFNDVLGFVVCLKDLTDLNPAFADYLKNYSPKKYYAHEMLRRKAFTESLKNLSDREQFNRIMAYEKDLAWFYFTYPETIPGAKILLTEIFKKQNNKFTAAGKFATLESLIITPNTMGVGEYILKYLDQHFDDLLKLAYDTEDIDIPNSDPKQTLTDLFIAMSHGVTEENEFPPLKNIGDKLIAMGVDESTIKSTIKYARKHRRTILFQRSALMKLFS